MCLIQPITQLTDRALRVLRRMGLLQILGAICAVTLFAASDPVAAMTFTVNTEASCREGVCVAARGEIDENTAQDFKAFIRANHIAPGSTVLLDSPGGRLMQGLFLGAEIRKAGLSTALLGTELQPASCASACVYAFLGGLRRTIAPGSKFGIHQMREAQNTASIDASQTQTLLGRVATHIRQMGASVDVFTLALRTPPEGMYWLTSAELSRFGVVTV